jgi:hypothetical protein
MKTSELTGALLDYWVAKSDRMVARVAVVNDTKIPYCIVTSDEWCGDKFFQPHFNWNDGGPIMERENITVQKAPDLGLTEYKWTAIVVDGWRPVDKTMALGPTYLIAAMRCYVTSKYGDEVPDQVCSEALATGQMNKI